MHAVSFTNSSFKHQNIVLHAVLLILLYVSIMNGHQQDYTDINSAAAMHACHFNVCNLAWNRHSNYKINRKQQNYTDIKFRILTSMHAAVHQCSFMHGNFNVCIPWNRHLNCKMTRHQLNYMDIKFKILQSMQLYNSAVGWWLQCMHVTLDNRV